MGKSMKDDKNNKNRKEKIIKVLHCIHSLSGGGAERQLGILIKYSNNYGIDSAIFCVNPDAYKELNGYAPVYCSSQNRKYNVKLLSDLSKVIEEFEPDIVHAWLPASMTIPTMIAAKIKKIPSVFSYRSRMRFHRFITVPEFFISALFASGIISNRDTSDSSPVYRWLYANKNGRVINNAVDIDQDYRKESHMSGNEKILLFVGRLIKGKNWQRLIRAVAELEAKVPWKLYICGDGDDRQHLVEMIRELNLEKNIIYLGFRDDVYKIMQKSDLLIMPSLSEGMPNVVVEALSIGLPCLLSDIIAHRDVMGDGYGDCFFDPYDVEELRDRISNFLENETMKEFLAHEGKIIARKYLPEKMVESYKNYYMEIIG